MSEQPQKKPRIEKLELDKETVAGLGEQEAEDVKGGAAARIVEENQTNRAYASCICGDVS